MLAPFKHKPNAEKIIRYNAACGREYVAERKVYAPKVGFLWEILRDNAAE